MVVTTKLKYDDSSNYQVIMMVQNFQKFPILLISEARSAEIVQTTTAMRFLFARDT